MLFFFLFYSAFTVVWKKLLFEISFHASKTIYATHTIFRFSVFFYPFHNFQHNKKISALFVVLLFPLSWWFFIDISVCTILFWIFVTRHTFMPSTFLFYDHHQNENAFKKNAHFWYNFYDYTKWQISFFRSFVCSMMREMCGVVNIVSIVDSICFLYCCFGWIIYVVLIKSGGCFHMRVKNIYFL